MQNINDELPLSNSYKVLLLHINCKMSGLRSLDQWYSKTKLLYKWSYYEINRNCHHKSILWHK